MRDALLVAMIIGTLAGPGYGCGRVRMVDIHTEPGAPRPARSAQRAVQVGDSDLDILANAGAVYMGVATYEAKRSTDRIMTRAEFHLGRRGVTHIIYLHGQMRHWTSFVATSSFVGTRQHRRQVVEIGMLYVPPDRWPELPPRLIPEAVY